MKNILKAGMLACICAMIMLSAQAQRIYVKVRPARPVVVVKRTPAPAVGHVWVEEDWVPQGTGYVWHGGYWAAPPRPRAVYVPGHWVRSKRGNIWITGYWR